MAIADIDQVARLALVASGTIARAERTARLTLARRGPHAAELSQLVRLTLARTAGVARADAAARLVLAAATPSGACGPIPLFPTLPVGFPVVWRPTLKTTVQTSGASGREARWPNQQVALHEIELPFEVLRDQTQNDSPYAPLAGFTDYMQLCQFWLMMYGQFGIFYFDAPWDDSRLGQVVGTGDGVTQDFTVFRTFGLTGASLTEPVGGINTMSTVYLNGVAQTPGTYFTGGNQLGFLTPPGAGIAITADFSFYYLCHFIADEQDYEEFLKNIWAVKSLKFRSVYFPQTAI